MRLRATLLAASLCALAGSVPVGAQVQHPLDPLTWQEHWTVLEVLRDADRYGAGTGVASVSLAEPDKAAVLAWQPGQPFARSALAVLLEDGTTREAVIDLRTRRLTSYRVVEGAQAQWLEYEFGAMSEDVRAHPDFIAAMERRGITDLTFIDCGGGPPGYFGIPEEEGRRVAYVSCYDARQVRNTYTRNIEGLTVVYDMNAGEVLRVIDEGVVPVPTTVADYDVASLGPLDDPLPPMVTLTPQGVGYDVDGYTVTWGRWRFHVKPDARTGMVISRVTFRDDERDRPVLYQGHLSEIFVPYMDPSTGWYTRNFLDLGEYVAGGLATSMVPGIDCPASATWFAGIVVQDDGRPIDVPRVICLFEREPQDPLWRHVDDGRPARELVARFTALLGNYDYVVDWVFRADASMQVRIGATGIPAVKATSQRDARAASNAAGGSGVRDDAYGRFVDRNIVAVNHEHWFNFRLDVDVDGPTNRLRIDRLEQELLPPDHPRRSLWVTRSADARTEHDARLDIDMHAPTLWRVLSARDTNAVGYPTSFQLLPGHNAHTLLSPDDYPRRRAGFIDHHLWVTPYRADERYAAGTYPTLSPPGLGLPAWTAANRPIDGADIVLWYTLGMHHVVRAEDWPVMPVAWASFELRPFDFFDRNPSLRLPH